MRAPNSTGSFQITSHHTRAVSGEGDIGDARLVDRLLISSQALVLVPESHTSILPADSQRLEEWVPLEGRNGYLIAGNLKVGQHVALLRDEDDSGGRSSDGEHHEVKFVFRPRG